MSSAQILYWEFCQNNLILVNHRIFVLMLSESFKIPTVNSKQAVASIYPYDHEDPIDAVLMRYSSSSGFSHISRGLLKLC